MLAKLLEAERSTGQSRTVHVICLGTAGPMAARIRATGIALSCLGMGAGGNVGTFNGLRALTALLRASNPDVVQCWMYHADLLGGLVSLLVTPRAARIWSIRASSMPHPASVRTRVVIRACALLSHVVPHRIISCSHAAARLHVDMGYDASRIRVIQNGFDLHRFVPDAHAALRLTSELGLPHETPIIGCVARFDPQKDFPTLFRAFAIVASRHSSATLVLAGHGCDAENPRILALIPDQCRQRVRLLGVRSDIPTLTAGFNVAVLTSAYGEGFPNVLGEALACGVPCVATDVGDSAAITGAEGVIASVGDADAIADGLLTVLRRPASARAQASARMRERALREYDLSVIAARYWQEQDDVAPSHQALALGADD